VRVRVGVRVRATGAAGAADAVDVVLDVTREVIVDDGLVRGRGRGRRSVSLG